VRDVQDGLLSAQTAASLRVAMAPKLSGVINLAACAPDSPMVVFSSIAGALGSAGQVCMLNCRLSLTSIHYTV